MEKVRQKRRSQRTHRHVRVFTDVFTGEERGCRDGRVYDTFGPIYTLFTYALFHYR